jgi:hypothetical protein
MKNLKSPFESQSSYKQETNNKLSWGRITRVFPEQRMAEVKTYGQQGMTNDLHIAKCQWLSSDAHYEGDETSVIPRINSFCVVAFIDSEPIIIGFFKPLSEAGDASTGKKLEAGNEGDKIITTVAGNKIILRSSGEIQIESTPGCRSTWFPQEDLLNHLCRNYEFRTEGGTIDWVNIDRKRKYTYLRKETRDTSNRKNIILEESGTVNADDTSIIYKKRIGAGNNTDGGINKIVHTVQVKNTGETDILIATADSQAGYKLNIKPSGQTSLNIADKAKLNIEPSGKTNYNVAGKANVSIEPSGDTIIDVGPGKSTIKISASGNIEVIATTKVKVKAPKVELNGAASGITTANSHMGVVDLITGVPVTPSTTVFSDV